MEYGKIVGIFHNLLNKEWADVCGEVYTPDKVTNKPKIHGVGAVGEAPNTEGRGG